MASGLQLFSQQLLLNPLPSTPLKNRPSQKASKARQLQQAKEDKQAVFLKCKASYEVSRLPQTRSRPISPTLPHCRKGHPIWPSSIIQDNLNLPSPPQAEKEKLQGMRTQMNSFRDSEAGALDRQIHVQEGVVGKVG